MNNGYSVSIAESSMQMSAKERIAFKDLGDAIKLDTATDDGEVKIDVAGYVVLAIHNDKSDNKDYYNYVVIGKDGNKYVTGSNSFWNSFSDIFTEMAEETEPWGIKVYKLASKNYAGKKFLTCSII